jgi:hypothetical protein
MRNQRIANNRAYVFACLEVKLKYQFSLKYENQKQNRGKKEV